METGIALSLFSRASVRAARGNGEKGKKGKWKMPKPLFPFPQFPTSLPVQLTGSVRAARGKGQKGKRENGTCSNPFPFHLFPISPFPGWPSITSLAGRNETVGTSETNDTYSS